MKDVKGPLDDTNNCTLNLVEFGFLGYSTWYRFYELILIFA